MDAISKNLAEALRPQPRRPLSPRPSPSGRPSGVARHPTNVIQFDRPAPLVAYMSDFVVVDGAASLLDQARLVEASPYARCGIARRYVDSGRPCLSHPFGHAFYELMGDARDKRFRAVLVETVTRLAPDLTSALRAAMLIMAEGIEIYEAVAGRVVVEPELAARIRFGSGS